MDNRIILMNELGVDYLVYVTPKELIENDYTEWCEKLESLGRSHLISEKNFIEDFMIVNWAWYDNPDKHDLSKYVNYYEL